MLSSVAAILMCCRHLAVLTSHIEVGIRAGSCHSRRGPITLPTTIAARLERWSSGACGTCFWPLQTDTFNSSVNSGSPTAAPPSIPLTDWSSQKRDGIFFLLHVYESGFGAHHSLLSNCCGSYRHLLVRRSRWFKVCRAVVPLEELRSVSEREVLLSVGLDTRFC